MSALCWCVLRLVFGMVCVSDAWLVLFVCGVSLSARVLRVVHTFCILHVLCECDQCQGMCGESAVCSMVLRYLHLCSVCGECMW